MYKPTEVTYKSKIFSAEARLTGCIRDQTAYLISLWSGTVS